MHFEHAGVATHEAEELAFVYEDLLGLEIVHEERFEGMEILFMELENGYFELIEPLEDGPISEYLDENGPGLHHVALRTEDIEADLERARDLGVDLIDEEPRPGAWGHEVAFFHPGSTGGVLLELVEH